jgi:hypothetical protein
MMGLQAGGAQPALVNTSKRPPIRSTHGRRTTFRLALPLSCPIEIGDDLAPAAPAGDFTNISTKQ